MYKKINIKIVNIFIVFLITLFTFNIKVNAATKGSCEYCGEICIQVNQSEKGKITYKYKNSRNDAKWKSAKNGQKVTVKGKKYPLNITSFSTITDRCPASVVVGLVGVGSGRKMDVRATTSCNNLKNCSGPITDTFYGVENGQRTSEASTSTTTTGSNNNVLQGSTTEGLLKPIGEKKKSCQQVLGSELVDKIQEVVDIVRILVPVLLIVFGIMDFGKAIFVNDENEMKKAQSTFFKRVIIAVAFFLVPSILQLLLKIGHSVWDVIPSDLCGIKF